MGCVYADILYFFRDIVKEHYVLLFILLLSWTVWTYVSACGNLPPGPVGFPLLGYLPILNGRPLKTLIALAGKYGGVFSFYLGNRLVVVLATQEAVKEALGKQGDNFAGRPRMKIFRTESGVPLPTPLFLSDGEIWKEHRRFALSTLKDFGIGKLSMEPRILDEVNHLMKSLRQLESQPHDCCDLIRKSTINVMYSLQFGQRLQYEDPDFKQIMHLITQYVDNLNFGGIYEFIPWVQRIPFFKLICNQNSAAETEEAIVKFLDRKIEDRSAVYEDGSQKDFVDAWLTEGRSGTEVAQQYFRKDQLPHVLRSLFVAGGDTTATTIRWALLYMALNPTMQSRVQKEIDDVIGHDRGPSIVDRSNMPYTEATLLEIQRIASVVALAIPHSNHEDTTLFGYFIPKNTYILPNLWGIHHNEDTYPNPEEFKPDRFLNEHGRVKKTEQFIPFSIGKRMCLGESLARMELFLYFTSLLQNFSFQKPKGEALSTEYELFGPLIFPKNHKLCAVPRM